jgi:hypothetical protein
MAPIDVVGVAVEMLVAERLKAGEPIVDLGLPGHECFEGVFLMRPGHRCAPLLVLSAYKAPVGARSKPISL